MDKVNWEEREEYMYSRHKITVLEATEAIADPLAVWIEPDPASKSGKGIRVIGWSTTKDCAITIILVNNKGELFGANGWKSDNRDFGIYKNGGIQ